MNFYSLKTGCRLAHCLSSGGMKNKMKKLLPLFAAIPLVLIAAAPLRETQPLTTKQEVELREEICSNFFVPQPLPPVDMKTYRTFVPAPGVKAEAFSYVTQAGMRVPAILYLPDPLPATKIPAFVVVNGHAGDKYSWYSYYTGILFARGGAAVLTYDQIGEGERNINRKSATREHDTIGGGSVIARHLAGLMICDAMQAVSCLCQRPEVDANRIAMGGYSMGSFVVSLTGAVDTRVHACVLCGGGDLDGPGGYWDKSKPMCQGLPYQSLDFLGDRPAVIYALHAARGPTLAFNGLGDTVVAIPTHGEDFFKDMQTRTAELHGSTNGVFDYGFAGTDCGHRPYWLTRPVVEWLQRQIAFSNWTEDKIKAMPQIKISDWTATHPAIFVKSFMKPLTEGGTLALDVNVPGYTHDELNMMTTEQWDHEKTNYILETWLARVQNPE